MKEAKRISNLRSDSPLTKVVDNEPPEMQLGSYQIPKYMKYSSRLEDNDIELARQRLRMNQMAHHKFDPYLESNEGQLYYKGVYEPNNPEHVEGTRENANAPKNLYAYNISKGNHKKAR